MLLKSIDNLEFQQEGLGFNYDYEFPYLHTHDYWEFVYTIKPIIHSINKHEQVINSNYIFIIKPNDEHSIKAVDNNGNISKLPTHLNVKISCDKLLEILSAFNVTSLESLNHLEYEPLLLKFDDIFYLTNIVNTILFEKNIDLITKALRLFIIFVLMKFPKFVIDYTTFEEIPEQIKIISTKLKSPAYFTLSLSEIMQESAYSKMQTQRLFKKYFNTTMQTYFQNAKLEHAIVRLKVTNDSILNIAVDIGFSLSYFDRFFKEKMNMTPFEYREKFKNNLIHTSN